MKISLILNYLFFLFLVWKKVNRTLPRSNPVFNLYQYFVPEDIYSVHAKYDNLYLTKLSFIKVIFYDSKYFLLEPVRFQFISLM